MLDWLKTPPTETALSASVLVGRSDSTVKRGLRTSRHHGLQELRKRRHGGVKELSLSTNQLEALDNRLQQPQGFESDEAIQIGLQPSDGIKRCYSTLDGIVPNRFQARPKVVRPYRAKRDEAKAIDFKKTGVTVKPDSHSLSSGVPANPL